MPSPGVWFISPAVALALAGALVGLRRLIAGHRRTDSTAVRLRRRWWWGVVLAFGFTLFLVTLMRFARPAPPGEETLGQVVLWTFSLLSGGAWFALIAFLLGDEVRFDATVVERRHPFRSQAYVAFVEVESMTLRSSARTQTTVLVLKAGAAEIRLDPAMAGFGPLAARILEKVRPDVVKASRVRPYLLPLAQPGRFGWDARDLIGYAADGSEDEFDPAASFVGDADEET